jgi:hypothetical protein
VLVPVVPVQYKKPKDLDPGLLELLLLKIVPVAVVLHFVVGSIFLVGLAMLCCPSRLACSPVALLFLKYDD